MGTVRRATLTCLLVALSVSPSRSAASPPITAAAFAPDGKHVVVGSQAGIEVRTWPELSREQSIATQIGNVHDLAFSMDGGRFAAAGGAPAVEGVLEIWRWPSTDRAVKITPHADVIYKIAWRSDARHIACASADQQVSLIDVVSSRVECRLTGHSRAVTSLVYLPGDRFLVTGGIDATLRLWDVSNREVLRSMTNHTAAVRDVVVQPRTLADAPVIASAGADRTIRLWQPLSGRLLRFVRLPSEPLDMDWTPDAKQIVVSCADGHLRVIDADSVAVIRDIPVLEGWAFSLAVSRDGQNALVGGSRGELRSVRIGN